MTLHRAGEWLAAFLILVVLPFALSFLLFAMGME